MTFVPGRGGFQQSYGPPASVLGMPQPSTAAVPGR